MPAASITRAMGLSAVIIRLRFPSALTSSSSITLPRFSVVSTMRNGSGRRLRRRKALGKRATAEATTGCVWTASFEAKHMQRFGAANPGNWRSV